MKHYLWAACTTACVALLVASSASAQATRTWVSGVGDDVNPCSRTAPCKTFAGAISKTFINGEINCLDPGGFGTITITKSITIDCHEMFGSVLASGASAGVIINIAAGNANDPLRTVRLRNLSINGAGASGSVGTRTGTRGIRILAATEVYIEDTLVSDFTNQGIIDERTSGGELHINNTTVRNNGGAAIVVAAGSPGVTAVIDNSRMMASGFGIAIANFNSALVRRSVISGNATGIETDPGGILSVNDSAIFGNDTGVQTGGTIRLSNNDITRNGNTFAGGSAVSFGNNRVADNGALGVALTAAGAASQNLGQQ